MPQVSGKLRASSPQIPMYLTLLSSNRGRKGYLLFWTEGLGSPQTHVLTLPLPRDRIRRRTFGGLIRMTRGHKGGALLNGISVL